MVKIGDLISQEIREKIARKSKIEKKIITVKKYSIPDDKPITLSVSEKELLKKITLTLQHSSLAPELLEIMRKKHFILVCKGQAAPVTEYERVYLKYIKIRELEKEALYSKRQSFPKQADQKESIIALQESDQERQKRKENAYAALRLAERQQKGPNISEYEDGYPRSEFGSRADHKKMRARDWGDMKKRNNEF